MSPKEIYDQLNKLFSDDGISINGFKIKVKSPMIAQVRQENKRVEIEFGSNIPKAEITKIITLYAYIEKIIFGEEGGSISLRNFPDLSFSYKSTMFSHDVYVIKNMIGMENIHDEIEGKYQEDSHKQIAKKCLQYAEEWATICYDNGVSFKDTDYADRYILRNNCYEFVKENVEDEAKQKYGSVILTWLLAYVVLPMIIKWVVNKVLERLFNND